MGRNMHIVRKFIEWVETTMLSFHRDDITASLSDCVDHAELEARMKDMKYKGLL